MTIICPNCGFESECNIEICPKCKYTFNYENYIKDFQQISGIIDSTTGKLEIIGNSIKSAKERFIILNENCKFIGSIHEKLKDSPIESQDPHYVPYLYSITPFWSFNLDFDYINNKIDTTKGEVMGLTGMTTTSSININTTLDMTTGYIKNLDETTFAEIHEEIDELPPILNKEDFIEKINKISPRLKNDYESAWNTFLHSPIETSFKEISHSLRELLSDFLQIFDPDTKNKNMKWCELSNGIPTQRSRVIFVILGNYEGFTWKNPIYKPYIDLATEYREEYKNLNKLAHYRKDEPPGDMKLKIENHFRKVHSLIESVLELKNDFESYAEINGISAKFIQSINGVPVEKIQSVNGVPIKRKKLED
jgi:hypothetical protein